MTDFSDRQKAFEDKFAHDEELMFKARARAAKFLAEWAAEKIGLPVDAYKAELVNLVTGGKDEEDLATKIETDASAKGIQMTKALLLEKFQQCLDLAKEQLAKG